MFSPGGKALADPARNAYRDTLVSLAKNGVRCTSAATTPRGPPRREEFTQMGYTLEYARDAFVGYALEDATLVSFQA